MKLFANAKIWQIVYKISNTKSLKFYFNIYLFNLDIYIIIVDDDDEDDNYNNNDNNSNNIKGD